MDERVGGVTFGMNAIIVAGEGRMLSVGMDVEASFAFYSASDRSPDSVVTRVTGSAGLATQSAKVDRQSGSAKPNVDSKRDVARTPYAGRRAGVGYSAVVIGTIRGLAASPTIARAKSYQLACPLHDRWYSPDRSASAGRPAPTMRAVAAASARLQLGTPI